MGLPRLRPLTEPGSMLMNDLPPVAPPPEPFRRPGEAPGRQSCADPLPALAANREPVGLVEILPLAGAEESPPPWEREPRANSAAVEAELKAFCRTGELVYAAIVDAQGVVAYSVCMVGSCPHNEARIGELVAKVFATALLLGKEVGEREPQGLNLQGSRWSYSLDPLADGQRLFGIFSNKSLPAIVRACAYKIRPALEKALESDPP